MARPPSGHRTPRTECDRLEVYNCCFSSQLLQAELAWTSDDPLLGYLLWNGPYAAQRRGVLAFRLDEAAFSRCVAHLEAMTALPHAPWTVIGPRTLGNVCCRLFAA
jgi:hypothetical protein